MNQPTKHRRTFPFIWPWRGENNARISTQKLLSQKAFSISYLVIIWTIVAILGFASTRARDCASSWEMEIYCEYAFWVQDLVGKPFYLAIRNLITTSFLHNGLDHILFVSLVGFLIIVQSHETLFGWKRTAFIFFSSYLTVAPFWAGFYTIGVAFYPENEFMQFAFNRNWMGGSIGMFQVYGALITRSKKPFVLFAIPAVFETINLILGIDLHISLMHWLAVLLGFLFASVMNKFKVF